MFFNAATANCLVPGQRIALARPVSFEIDRYIQYFDISKTHFFKRRKRGSDIRTFGERATAAVNDQLRIFGQRSYPAF